VILAVTHLNDSARIPGRGAEGFDCDADDGPIARRPLKYHWSQSTSAM